jgi:hypothetical protein
LYSCKSSEPAAAYQSLLLLCFKYPHLHVFDFCLLTTILPRKPSGTVAGILKQNRHREVSVLHQGAAWQDFSVVKPIYYMIANLMTLDIGLRRFVVCRAAAGSSNSSSSPTAAIEYLPACHTHMIFFFAGGIY